MKNILILFFLLLIFIFIIISIHSYLSFDKPILADILLVEGWMSIDYATKIIEEFYRRHYSEIVVVGTIKSEVFEKKIVNICPNADLLTMKLHSLSNGKININLIHSSYVNKHQTFNYMLFFKDWLLRNLPNVKSVNLFSVSVHARKSYLILRRLLPNSIKLGVISASPVHFSAEYWWLSGRGIWVFFKNTVSLIYAYIFENCHHLKC